MHNPFINSFLRSKRFPQITLYNSDPLCIGGFYWQQGGSSFSCPCQGNLGENGHGGRDSKISSRKRDVTNIHVPVKSTSSHCSNICTVGSNHCTKLVPSDQVSLSEIDKGGESYNTPCPSLRSLSITIT